jgi:hypothetical protein
MDEGIEQKKMKMERTQMLSLEGYIIGKSVINFSIFFGGRPPLPLKKNHVEKYDPFPRYKIKPTNDSEYTEFHFDCHIICLPLQNRCRLQCLVNSRWEIK